jgi:hypothetical protein
MRVPVRVFASEKLLAEMDDKVFEQAANVATLPGIVESSLCMPDAHWGYGFPIGGVAAMDAGEGVISPGGIGFDINCGMRLVRRISSWPGAAADPRTRRRSRSVCQQAWENVRARRCDAFRGAASRRRRRRSSRATNSRRSALHRGGGCRRADPDCVSGRHQRDRLGSARSAPAITT